MLLVLAFEVNLCTYLPQTPHPLPTGGITLNQTYYRISVPVDAEVNTSSILDLGAEIIIDPTYVKKNVSLTFTRVSNSNFGITKEGHIYPRVPLIANINYYLTAYYTYTIIDINDKTVTYSAYVRVYVSSKGVCVCVCVCTCVRACVCVCVCEYLRV